MYLIGGLGNPGRRYSLTRHNIGFMVINQWAGALDVRLTGRRFQSRNIRTALHKQEIILIRPLTFMNLSGKSILACVDTYDVNAEHILVIHDDIDLPVGRIRVVRGGSAGGHNGILSIIQYLGTKHFPRIKIGVGRPRHGEPIEEFVLSPFYRDEKEIVEEVIRTVIKACELFVSNGVEAAMNHTNCQNLADKLRRY